MAELIHIDLSIFNHNELRFIMVVQSQQFLNKFIYSNI